MRGVHYQVIVDNVTHKGSSPHARGPPEILPFPAFPLRIIPACAGSTPGSAAAA